LYFNILHFVLYPFWCALEKKFVRGDIFSEEYVVYECLVILDTTA